MEPRRSPSFASRNVISRWAERFIYFGCGVFVTIAFLHAHDVHTTDHFEAFTLASFFSFEPPNTARNIPDMQPRKTVNERRTPLSPRQKSRLGIKLNKDKLSSAEQGRQLPERQVQQPAKIVNVAPERATQEHNPRNRDKEDNQTKPKSEKAKKRNHAGDLTLLTKTAEEKSETETKNDARLNIVLLYADDWTMRVLGKLDPNVKTPNIDQMADNGMLFTNNCVTTSVCWISRATLVTGVYYSRHLQFAPHSTNMYTTNPWNETLFPKLKAAGYYTGLMGKWHLPQPEEEMEMAFDQRNFYYGEHWSDEFSEPGSKEVRQITDRNLEDSIEFLQNRPKDQKFFLKVSFFATHAWDNHYPSYNPKNETRRQFYPDSMYVEPPRTATEWHWENLPRFFTEQNEGRSRWRRRFEPDYFQSNIKDLYAMATEVDIAVGAIIEELKQQSVFDQTLLIFTTDNGNLHGEHGLAEKWYPFEESLRVPLVIQDPRMPKAKRGGTNDAWTLSVDLAPTILGAANLEASSFMQGRDLSKLYLDKSKDGKVKWRNDWYYEWNMGHPLNASGHPQTGFIDAAQALISTDWKYIYWPEQDFEQLFHRKIDPFDEWDLIKKDNLMNTSDFNATADGNLQTTKTAYEKMKARFIQLREHVMAGKAV